MELNDENLRVARRYYALIRAAANAKNPEFKALWKSKLAELIRNNQQEVNKNGFH